MKITIVNGFFLPVPPLAGGATEKSWHELARRFAERGHQVTSISRRWPELPDEEFHQGIRHVRLPGCDHHRSTWRNLIRDFRWGRQVSRHLPAADIVVCNTVALPVWLGRRQPQAGKVVVMCGRMPKGQYRWYRHIARVLAPSSLVRDRVVAENRSLAPNIRVTGYPIDWRLFQGTPAAARSDEVTLGYVGRLHREKGLELLVIALETLARRPGLPPWRFVICGPAEVERGGSGTAFRDEIMQRLAVFLTPTRLDIRPAEFDSGRLATLYRSLDVFCYPSLAESGETFGVAVAEAMAAGAVPVVSDLACFRDFVTPERNGAVFDHRAPDAAARLANALAALVTGAETRKVLGERACQTVQRYDFDAYADELLADFERLTGAPGAANIPVAP